MSDTAARIRTILAEALGFEVQDVTDETSLTDDLGADSLEVMDAILDVERAFGVEVEDADIDRMKTVGDVVRFFQERVDGR